MMIQQFGFDFGDAPTHSFVLHPEGTFLDPERTSAEYTDYFAKAESALLAIAGPARALFRMGIETAKKEQARFDSFREADSTYGISPWFNAPAELVEAFVAHCKAMEGTAHPGFEYKVRHHFRSSVVAMYADNIGSLIVRSSKTRSSIEYAPYRDSFFIQGYMDDAPAMEAPIGLWRRTYCADKIAFAKGAASVKSFALNGRRYIVTGMSYFGNEAHANAWTFCRIEDWHGETFTYQSHGSAVDEGRLERGDYRGIVVRVDGQLCVIDGYATVFDDNADKDTTPLCSDDEEDDEDVSALEEEEELEPA